MEMVIFDIPYRQVARLVLMGVRFGSIWERQDGGGYLVEMICEEHETRLWSMRTKEELLEQMGTNSVEWC